MNILQKKLNPNSICRAIKPDNWILPAIPVTTQNIRLSRVFKNVHSYIQISTIRSSTVMFPPQMFDFMNSERLVGIRNVLPKRIQSPGLPDD